MILESTALRVSCNAQCGPRRACLSRTKPRCVCDSWYLVQGPDCSTPTWGAVLQLLAAVVVALVAVYNLLDAMKLLGVQFPRRLALWPLKLFSLKRRAAVVPAAGDVARGDTPSPSPVHAQSDSSSSPPPATPPPSATVTVIIPTCQAASPPAATTGADGRQARKGAGKGLLHRPISITGKSFADLRRIDQRSRWLHRLKLTVAVNSVLVTVISLMVGSLPYIPTAQVLPTTAALLACSVAGSVADALSWQVTLLLLLDISFSLPIFTTRQRLYRLAATKTLTFTMLVTVVTRLLFFFPPYYGPFAAEALLLPYHAMLLRSVALPVALRFRRHYANNPTLRKLSTLLQVMTARVLWASGTTGVLTLVYLAYPYTKGLPIQVPQMSFFLLNLLVARHELLVAGLLSARPSGSGQGVSPLRMDASSSHRPSPSITSTSDTVATQEEDDSQDGRLSDAAMPTADNEPAQPLPGQEQKEQAEQHGAEDRASPSLLDRLSLAVSDSLLWRMPMSLDVIYEDDRLSDASELRSTVGHRRESLLNQSSSSGHSSSSSKSAEESRGRGIGALDCDSNPSSARASDAKEEQVAQVLP